MRVGVVQAVIEDHLQEDFGAVAGHFNEIGVANVTLYKLGVRIEVLWTSIAVDLFHDGVQNSDTMTLLDQCIDNVRADETGASRNQYVHSSPRLMIGATILRPYSLFEKFLASACPKNLVFDFISVQSLWSSVSRW